MTITYGISLIVTSIVLPFVVALLQNESWSSRTKEWIAVAISFIVGAAYVVQSGLAITDIVPVSVTFVGGCQTAYLCFVAIGVKSKVLDALSTLHVSISNTTAETTTTDTSTDTTEKAA
jgi:SNF family Na+-dependent transporter